MSYADETAIDVSSHPKSPVPIDIHVGRLAIGLTIAQAVELKVKLDAALAEMPAAYEELTRRGLTTTFIK